MQSSDRNTTACFGTLIAAVCCLMLWLAPSDVQADPADFLPATEVTAPAALVEQNAPAPMPVSFAIGFDGSDPDGATAAPTRYRYLLTWALLPEGGYATTQAAVEENLSALVAYSKGGWSEWLTWREEPEDRQILLADLRVQDEQLRTIYYLVVLQAMDDVSAVSVERIYGVNMVHFYVDPAAVVGE